jgi:hypothetical protein
MFYTPLQRWGIFKHANFYGRGCPFTTQGERDFVNYDTVSTPVADAICDRVNIEIKVQPTSSASEMVQIAKAIKKVLSHRNELKTPLSNN